MKIAVIGAGISGVGAAWILSQNHEVHLFESEKRLGGHAHTFNLDEDGKNVPLDVGFLVYNEVTYPHLKAFFKHLNVETVDSDMSLSVQVKEKGLEWSGTNLNSVFGQRRNLLNFRFYKMLFEILRFGREAEENLALSHKNGWSLSDLLREKNFSREFSFDYLLPIGAAIWSTPETKMFDFPAETFLRFFINHQLLQVNNRPVWRTVKNGSIQYVQKAAAKIAHVHVSTPVLSVERRDLKVIVQTQSESMEFDKVVFATHAPLTAKILKAQSAQEARILSSFKYEANRADLHCSSLVMPRKKLCWASWNVLGHNNSTHMNKVSLNYYLNRLQPLPTEKDYFLSLNPPNPISESLQEFTYSHPQFDQAAILAQRDLPSMQGNGGVYFAGAWTRYGFHEDGLLSAVNVAEQIGVSTPWKVS
jgi:predicted NAD/FAD-binding protein